MGKIHAAIKKFDKDIRELQENKPHDINTKISKLKDEFHNLLYSVKPHELLEKDPEYGDIPFMLAVRINCEHLINLFLSHKIDPTLSYSINPIVELGIFIPNNLGQTPFMYSYQRKDRHAGSMLYLSVFNRSDDGDFVALREYLNQSSLADSDKAIAAFKEIVTTMFPGYKNYAFAVEEKLLKKYKSYGDKKLPPIVCETFKTQDNELITYNDFSSFLQDIKTTYEYKLNLFAEFLQDYKHPLSKGYDMFTPSLRQSLLSTIIPIPAQIPAKDIRDGFSSIVAPKNCPPYTTKN